MNITKILTAASVAVFFSLTVPSEATAPRQEKYKINIKMVKSFQFHRNNLVALMYIQIQFHIQIMEDTFQYYPIKNL